MTLPGHWDRAELTAEDYSNPQTIAALLRAAGDETGEVLPFRAADALDRLREALNLLDLSDDYTLEQAQPGELISCARPVEVWRKVREALRND